MTREERIAARGQSKADWTVAERLVGAWIESDDLPRTAYNAMDMRHFVELARRIEYALSCAIVDALTTAERDRDAALSCCRGACANRDEVAGERDGLRAKVDNAADALVKMMEHRDSLRAENERMREALREIDANPCRCGADQKARRALAETGDGNG